MTKRKGPPPTGRTEQEPGRRRAQIGKTAASSAASCALLLVALPLTAALPAAAAQPANGRVRPPTDLACPRDQLTLYGGQVLAYSRSPGRTVIRIRTDWQSTETVTLRHPGTKDPSRWFLIEQRPFEAADWPRIEEKPGRLRKDIRAAAWVCSDGRNATIDWTPPRTP